MVTKHYHNLYQWQEHYQHHWTAVLFSAQFHNVRIPSLHCQDYAASPAHVSQLSQYMHNMI